MSADREREASSASAYTDNVGNSLFGRSAWGRIGMRELLRRRGRFMNAAPDPNLTRRRPLYIIALLLLLASILTQFSLIFVCGLLLLGIAIAPELWYRFGLRGLVILRESETHRARLGAVVAVPITVENRKLLPLPMVETEDEFPEALPVLATSLQLSARPGSAKLTRGMRLWAFQRLRRRYYLHATQRGAYLLGPTLVRVSDPFGILTRENVFDTSSALLVHPLIAPLERFGIAPRALFGDHASRLRLLEDPLRVAGVRAYVSGDDPRRVHWKATARLGALQSKRLDPSTQRTLVIALDVRTFNQAQLGYDPDLAEFGIAVAASVAAWAVERGYAVGLIANGAFSTIAAERASQASQPHDATTIARSLPRLRLEPAARPEQLTLILDGLARVILFGGGAMAPLITSEMRAAPSGSTLVYVGLESLVDVATLIALRQAQASGHAVSLTLTTRDADDPFAVIDESRNLHATSLPTHYVGGRARWQALIAEALDGLPPRQATEIPGDERLAAERNMIVQTRQARVARRNRRTQSRNGVSHAE